jgi:dienelactone hydrolase
VTSAFPARMPLTPAVAPPERRPLLALTDEADEAPGIVPAAPRTAVGADVQMGWFRTADGVPLALTRRRRTDGAWSARRPPRRRERVVLVAPGLFTARECPEHQAFAERLTEIADVAALATQLRREYARVGAVGFSFGGYHVGAAAAVHRTFDAVAMVATPRCFSPLDRHFLLRGIRKSLLAARRRRGYAGRFTLLPFRPGRRPAMAFVGEIAPTPLLLVHGTGDWLLGTHHVEELYRRATDPKSLVLVEGGSHAEGMMVAHAHDLIPPLVEFLNREL